MQKRTLSKIAIALISSIMSVNLVQSATFGPYTPISTTGTLTDNGCDGSGVTVEFDVTDDFTITDVNLGVYITHSYRGDLVMSLTSPTRSQDIKDRDGGDGSINFNVLMDDESLNGFGGNHPLAPPDPEFTNVAGPDPDGSMVPFYGDDAMGTWEFFVCDGFNADTGAFVNAELFFEGDLNSTLQVVKSAPVHTDADFDGFVTAGDTLTYTVTATNIGAVDLNNVIVSDPLPLTPIGGSTTPCATVTAGNDCVLVGTYTVQPVDELVESITNTASALADGVPPVSSNTVTIDAGTMTPDIPEDVFYMPLPEPDALTAFQSLFPGPNVNTGVETCPNSTGPTNPISTYSSITVLRNNTIIYYDHHENGYEADTLNPDTIATGGTSEIWGDEDIANGFAPGSGCTIASPDSCDVLNAGIIILLDNLINTALNPEVQDDFDGGDKLSASDTISMTKANWSTGPSTLLAGALELYPTNQWGTLYQIPVGQDIATPAQINAKYQYVGLTIMAQQDSTEVVVDINGPSVAGGETTYNLDEGDSQFIDGGILVGATVESNFNVQVDIISGDICANYESRWFTLFPTELWDNSYYNPVGTEAADPNSNPVIPAAPVRVMLFNPVLYDVNGDPVLSGSSITVLIQDSSGSSTVTVPYGDIFDYLQDDDTGAHYCTTTDNTTCADDGVPFYAIAAIDADNDTTTAGDAGLVYDWGFTLVPQTSLSQQALVGLGFGNDPLITNAQNSSPVWVSADLVDGTNPQSGGIQLCVDFDNDGTDSGGPNIDPVTGQEFDITFSVDLFESVKLYDTDGGDPDGGDQTSLLVWICDTDANDSANAILAVAWGQDPSAANRGAPAIDVGTGVPNVSSLVIIKEGRLSNDLNGDGFPSIGDTITYLITLTNVGFVPVDGEVLTDALPANVSYQENTTIFNNNTGSGFVSLPDTANPTTPFPLDEGGVSLPGLVQPGQTFLVSFDVIVTSLPLDDVEMCNSTSVNIPIEVVNDEHCLDFLPRTASLGNFVWADINQNGIQDGGELGIPGVTVTLLDEFGDPIVNGEGGFYSTTTDANGVWALENLPAGDYKVLFDTTTSTDGQTYAPTAQGQGSDGAIDSDGAPNGVTSQVQNNTFSLAEDEMNIDIDTGFYPVYSVIGDRVWLDLDNDGIQDANEDGIANAVVTLTPPAGVDAGAGTDVEITTVTDSEGNYLFTTLPLASGYTVTVSNLPSGLVQTYDEDDPMGPGSAANTDDSSVVNLTTPNQEYLSADFGYGPAQGTIGDYVWSDANGDGQQDPGEIGLENVTVYLCETNTNPCNNASPNFISSTTTDDTGRYLFTGLSGMELTVGHVVEVDTTTLPLGYTTQTGDPDGLVDDQTTVPALNTSNGINLDADFGYQPPNNGTHFSIGDTIYQDLDGDGIEDMGVEPGIPGVTVQLFRDDSPDIPLASVITDENGFYEFPALPSGVDYIILVTDTRNILNGFVQTGDPDGGLDNQSALTLNANNDLQDFGYRPVRVGTGIIGDRVFLDVDRDGSQSSADQGLEGVTVRLFNSVTDDYIGITTTDENGNYLFTGLNVSNSYRVVVENNTLPNGGTGLTNNIDPDGGVASESIVDLSMVPGGISLIQDFGYIGAQNNTIGGTVWSDNDGSGVLTDGSGGTPDETGNGIENVTVVLTDSNNNIVGTTTTGPDGSYSFTGLPDGTYTVAVTDDHNELANLLHTDGPPGTVNDNAIDNNSQDDTGYDVTVAGSETNTTGDFGYRPVITTPITLASFKAVYDTFTGINTINWGTLTETGNVGFNLYKQVEGQWIQVNEQIIPSKSVYKTSLTNYQYTYLGEFVRDWAIVDVDIRGKHQSHGVFRSNQLYGIEDEPGRNNTNWQSIISAHQQRQNEQDMIKADQLNQYINQNLNGDEGDEQ